MTDRSLLLLQPLEVLTAIHNWTIGTRKWHTPFVQVQVAKQRWAI